MGEGRTPQPVLIGRQEELQSPPDATQCLRDAKTGITPPSFGGYSRRVAHASEDLIKSSSGCDTFVALLDDDAPLDI